MVRQFDVAVYKMGVSLCGLYDWVVRGARKVAADVW